MSAELYRSETAICAMSATTLAPDSWAHDAILAAGMCAQRNRLGNLLLHFIDECSKEYGAPRALATEIILIVTSRIMTAKEQFRICHDSAFQAFEYWNGRRCLHCGGRGVMNFQQDECPVCHGTGERPIEGTDMVKAAISVLIEAENMMEGQLRKKMSDSWQDSPRLPIPRRVHVLEESPYCGWVSVREMGAE